MKKDILVQIVFGCFILLVFLYATFGDVNTNRPEVSATPTIENCVIYDNGIQYCNSE